MRFGSLSKASLTLIWICFFEHTELAFENAPELNPNHIPILLLPILLLPILLLPILLLPTGHAELAYENALELNPNHIPSLTNLRELKRGAGDDQGAKVFSS